MAAEHFYLAADSLYPEQLLRRGRDAGLQDHFCEVGDNATDLFVAFHHLNYIAYGGGTVYWCGMGGSGVFDLGEGGIERECPDVRDELFLGGDGGLA